MPAMTNNSKILTRRNVFLAVAVLLAGVLIFLFLSRQSQSDTPTLESPLKDVPFPTQTIPYPEDWLDELRYPKEFQLVDVSFGTLPDSNTKGYAAKLRFQGAPQSAADLLLSFFSEKGWKVAEQSSGGSGIVILIQDSENKSGTVIIDSDSGDSNNAIILVTIFP